VVLGLLGVGFTLVLLFRKLASQERLASLSVDQFSEFSADKYRPLEKLLSDTEYGFLVGQPGFDRDIGRRFRAERRRIFRRYLRCLKRDFDRLYTAAKLVALYSTEDRPDLARVLLRQRCGFQLGLLAVEWRLLLHTLGWGTADVRRLVEALESVHSMVQRMMLFPQVDLA